MKRLLVFSILILLVLCLLPACVPIETSKPEAPVSAPSEDTPTNLSLSVKDVIPNLKPNFYLLDTSGDKTYGVYKFSIGGNNCVVIADVYNAPAGDSNSAPSLFCERETK